MAPFMSISGLGGPNSSFTKGGASGAPFFNWKYYAYGTNIKETNVIWGTTDGTMNLLRTISGQQHTGTGQTWNSYSEDLSAYSGTTGRIYFAYKTGTFYYQDPQFDAMQLIDTTNGDIDHDPGTSTGRSRWQRLSGYNASLDAPNASAFQTISTSTSTSDGWNYDYGGTPSGSTGNNQDSDGSTSGYYLYFEGSNPNYTSSTRYYWVRMSQDYTLN